MEIKEIITEIAAAGSAAHSTLTDTVHGRPARRAARSHDMYSNATLDSNQSAQHALCLHRYRVTRIAQVEK